MEKTGSQNLTKQQNALQESKWNGHVLPLNNALDILKHGTQVSKAKAGNPDKLLAVIVEEITGLMLAFKVNRTFQSPQEIRNLAEGIIEDFWYLRIEDIRLCFRRAKNGLYGNVYERLDSNTIYSWLNRYDAEEKTPTSKRHQESMPKAEPFKDIEEVKQWYARGQEYLAKQEIAKNEKRIKALEAERERQLNEMKYEQSKEEYFEKRNSGNNQSV